MPTIRAIFPVTIRADVVINRDFELSREYQLAKAFYEALTEMAVEDAIDYLHARMTVEGDGVPYTEPTGSAD